MKKKLPGAEPPYELKNLSLDDVKDWAAGLPAIQETMSHTAMEEADSRGVRALFRLNQFDGIDCPSCAWPDPDDERSPVAEYCESGAKAIAHEATSRRIGAGFFAEHSVGELQKLDDYEIGQLGRIAEPLYKPEGATHYQAITYEAAFQLIANELNQLEHPDQAVFYNSGRTSNEASFVWQLFARQFGTNNLPDCANMCQETSGTALETVIGRTKGTVTLEDIHQAEAILIIGQNPGTNAPRMLSALDKAKKNGAKIIAINPLPEAGLHGFRDPQKPLSVLGKTTPIADLFLPVRINGDLALLKAIEQQLYFLEQQQPGQVFDLDFIARKTGGYEGFIQHLSCYVPQELAEQAGVELEKIQQAAHLLKDRSKIVALWGMGITQQTNGVDIVREIVNLLLLKGSIGKPGAGACPVRGHSNVQGNRTMLIDNQPKPEQLDRLEKNFGFRPPRNEGLDVRDSVHAIHQERVKVLLCMGGNLLSAAPDTQYFAEGLEKLNLVASVSTKLNRTHLIVGKQSLILPTLIRSEKDIVRGELQFVSTENAMGIVQWSHGTLEPIAEDLRNETQLICGMARATLGQNATVDWDIYAESYDALRNDIARTIPGFENYNEKVRQKGGFYLPNPPREGKFDSKDYAGKAAFTISELPNHTLKEGEFVMATTRSHDQFNTTVYGYDDRYRGIRNERRVILMNAHDIQEAGLQAGDVVDLFNYDDGRSRRADKFVVVSYPIPRRNVVTYFPEANALVSAMQGTRESNMPVYKYVRIQVRKHQPEPAQEPNSFARA